MRKMELDEFLYVICTKLKTVTAEKWRIKSEENVEGLNIIAASYNSTSTLCLIFHNFSLFLTAKDASKILINIYSYMCASVIFQKSWHVYTSLPRMNNHFHLLYFFSAVCSKNYKDLLNIFFLLLRKKLNFMMMQDAFFRIQRCINYIILIWKSMSEILQYFQKKNYDSALFHH